MQIPCANCEVIRCANVAQFSIQRFLEVKLKLRRTIRSMCTPSRLTSVRIGWRNRFLSPRWSLRTKPTATGKSCWTPCTNTSRAFISCASGAISDRSWLTRSRRRSSSPSPLTRTRKWRRWRSNTIHSRKLFSTRRNVPTPFTLVKIRLTGSSRTISRPVKRLTRAQSDTQHPTEPPIESRLTQHRNQFPFPYAPSAKRHRQLSHRNTVRARHQVRKYF